MADRESVGEQPVLSMHVVPQEEIKDENIVSSSTVETDSAQDMEDVGTESLPQTYQVSPVEMVAQAGHIRAGHITSPYVSTSSMQLSDVSSALMAQAAYITVTQPHSIPRMTVLHATDVGSVSLPQTSDVRRICVCQADDISSIRMSQTDVSEMSMPSTVDIHRMSVSKTDGITRLNVHQTSNISQLNVPHTVDIGRMNMSQTVDVNAVTLPHTRDVCAMTVAQTPDLNSVRMAHSGEASNLRMVQANEISSMAVSQMGDVRCLRDSHAGDMNNMNISQSDDVNGLRLHQTGSIAGIVQQTENMGQINVPYTISDVGRMNMSTAASVSRMIVHQSDLDRMSIPHTEDACTVRLPLTGDISRLNAAQYSEANSMTLPQTRGIGVVSLPHIGDVSALRIQMIPEGIDVNKLNMPEQPHTDDINMRMMAEAAEIISRNAPQADDVNMRLMAETADYISRNVPQTSVIIATGNLMQTVDINSKMVTPASSINSLSAPQTASITVRQLCQNTDISNTSQPHYVNSMMAGDSINISAGSITSVHDAGKLIRRSTEEGTVGVLLQEDGTNAVATDVEMKTETKQGGGAGQNQIMNIASGFQAGFLECRNYSRWKQIGLSQDLHSDEEIASFLIKYYDDTAAVFPSGSTVCGRCQRQLTVSCVSCLRHAADDYEAEGDDGEDSREDLGGDDARTQLWKIILEASSKEKGGEFKVDALQKQSNRRKPKKTQRVPQKKEKEAAAKPSSEVKNEKDSPGLPDQSDFNTSIHFEEEFGSGQKSLSTPGTRKRGRPSNDSYLLVSTLECSGCQKKFHTMVGLEKHIKLKRCKAASKTGGSLMSDEDEEEKPALRALAPFRFECSECKKKYRSKQGLMLHKISKHGEFNEKYCSALSDGDEDTEDTSPAAKVKSRGMYECGDCRKKYRSRQGLMLHKVSKHSEVTEKKVKEETDEGKDTESSDAGKEDSKIKGSLVLQCTQCQKKYNSRPGLMLHIRTKHSPQVLLDCNQCHLRFKTKLDLRIHIRREHSEGQIILFCPYCPDTFHNRDILKDHMADNHKTCRQVLYDCFACDLQFSSRIERKRHIQSEHKGKDTSLTCRFCGGWFATRLEYSQHEKDGHPEQNQSWLCATCGDAFPTRYLLQRHTLTHKDKIDCELCGKSITEPCYEDHMKRHYGTKTWKCDLCPKSFIRKAELQQHTLVHKDERPFCCELCGIRYREKSRLNSHMRTHTGIKPYKCSQCEKCFTRSRELKNHMRVHTGEKPFSCSVCGRKFASSGNLSAHRRKVHKLSPIPHGQQSRRHMLEEKIRYQASIQASIQASTQIIQEAPAQETSAVQNAPLAHQAPIAHQSSLAHQDPLTVFHQQVVAKYESLVTQPEHYNPQPVIHPPQSTLPMYWPNTSYDGET